MRRAPAVLLLLLVMYGFLSPPGLRAQDTGPPQPTRAFRLEQNTPNPIIKETWIPFYLEESLFANGETRLVTIQIFNVLSQQVAVPRARDHPQGKNLPVFNLAYTEPGPKLAYWDGKDAAGHRVPAGVYYCQMVVNGQTQMRKMIVVNPRRSRIPIPWFGRGSRPD